MKNKFIIVLTLVIVFTLASCNPLKNSGNSEESSSGSLVSDDNISETVNNNFDIPINDVVETDKDKVETQGSITDSKITFFENKITTGNGVTVDGNVATITKQGIYTVSGTTSNGQIVVNVAKEERVELILNGINLTCPNNCAIIGENSDIIIITLADGTENFVSDGNNYSEDDDPTAAIFSKDDITIKGTGSLSVNGNYNNGISSSNDIKIIGGTISVNSKNTAIRGKDSVKIGKGCNISINSDGDAIKSTNDSKDNQGIITITGGIINIASQEDGLDASGEITIKNSFLNLKTGNGKALADNTSYKAIKSDKSIIIMSGNFTIVSADDAIHCGGDLIIAGGVFSIISGDDGIQSDAITKIYGGMININKSNEGLKGNSVEIYGGEIRITSTDDGINSAADTDLKKQKQNNLSSGNNHNITISGGLIVINASGDGIDSNGSIMMSAGTLLICGPTNDENGPIDYNNNSFKMTGGLMIATGSSKMAQGISISSTQYGMLALFKTQSSNTILRVEDSNGNDIITFAPCKQYSSVALCTPSLEKGKEYKILFGGNCDDISNDGLYSNGSYSGGTKYTAFTVNSILTILDKTNVY